MVKFDAKPSLGAPQHKPALFGAGEEPSVAKQEVKKEEKLSFAKAILESHSQKPQVDFRHTQLGVATPKKDKKEGTEATSDAASELPSTAELLARLNKPGHTPDHWSKKFPPGLAKFFEETWKHAHHFVAAAAVAAEAEVEDADEKDDVAAPEASSESTSTDAPVSTIAVGEPAPVVVEPKPVIEETAPVVVEPKPVVEEPAPVVVEEKPVVEEPAPAVIESTTTGISSGAASASATTV